MARSAGARPSRSSLEVLQLEADTIRALAHPKRLMLLGELGTEGASVSELAAALGLPLPNVSQHLRILRDRGIVRAERFGQVVRYRVTSPAFQECCTTVRRLILRETERREAELRAPGPVEPTRTRLEAIPA